MSKNQFFNYIQELWMDKLNIVDENILQEALNAYKVNLLRYDDHAVNQIFLALGFNMQNNTIVSFLLSDEVNKKNYSWRYFAPNKVFEKEDIEQDRIQVFWNILNSQEAFETNRKEYKEFISSAIITFFKNDAYKELNKLFCERLNLINKDHVYTILQDKKLAHFFAFESDENIQNKFNSYILKNYEKLRYIRSNSLLNQVDFNNLVEKIQNYTSNKKIFTNLTKKLNKEECFNSYSSKIKI